MEEHIPIDRLRQVTHKCDAFLSKEEERHLHHCLECLNVFTELVLGKRDSKQDT